MATKGWDNDPHSNPQLMELKWVHNEIELIGFKINTCFYLKNVLGVAQLIKDDLSHQNCTPRVHKNSLSAIGSQRLNEKVNFVDFIRK